MSLADRVARIEDRISYSPETYQRVWREYQEDGTLPRSKVLLDYVTTLARTIDEMERATAILLEEES